MPKLLPALRSALIKPMLWALVIVLFFAAGFVPTFLLAAPAVGMTLAVAGIIPLGSKSRSPARAVVRGIAFGAVAGVAVVTALGLARQGDIRSLHAAIYIGSTILICTAVAALFYHMAQRRKQLIDRQWE